MPASSQFDAREQVSLDIPYDRSTKILADNPRLVSGSSNVYVDRGNSLRKCGGLADQSLDITGHRIDRLLEYDCENGRRYLIASCYDTINTNWTVYYLRLDGVGVWTEIPNLRNVQDSEYPHEMVVARGQVFIKGFPGAAGDKLGSVIFDGRSTPVTRFWGLLGPSVAARRSGATSTWSASTTAHDVLVGWKYVYSWVTSTGHESSRSSLERDPALQPSDTGAFSDKIPNITVQGLADTTNVPFINVYRTYDGGGTFLFVEQITNTGVGAISYLDTNRTGTPGDPKLDSQLDSERPSASLTSNYPPATVEEGTIGTDTVERSSPLAYWSSRIWYSVGRNLYFSANDEVRAGAIEESFPGGATTGNRFRMKGEIKNLIPTVESLVCSTSRETVEFRGAAREDIRGIDILTSVGGGGQREGTANLEGYSFWIDQHNRIRAMQNRSTMILSDSLNREVIDALDTQTSLSLTVYQAPRIDWLILSLHDLGTPANSRWWVLDLSRLSQGPLWSPPWTKNTTAVATGITEAGVSYLYAAVFDGSDSQLAVYDDNIYADMGTGFAFAVDTNLFTVPDGNHVHRLAKTRMMCNMAEVKVGYVGNTPTVKVGLDTDGALTDYTSNASDPPRTVAGDAGYEEKFYNVNSVAQRARIGISRTADANPFSLESFAFIWEPTQKD